MAEIKLIVLPLALGLLLQFTWGCSHYSSPDFVSQGEYLGPGSSPLNSNLGQSAYIPRSPFQLIWPVRKLQINRGFDHRGRRPHNGIDIGGRKGDPVYAAHPGVVVYAGRGFRGYGNMVLLEYDQQWASLYAHLSRIKVKTGTSVDAGKVIGNMGKTGRASGVHLHFELLKNKIPVDPLPILESFKTALATGDR